MKPYPRRKSLPPESETVEWKQSLGEWKEIVETCAAFATAQGGIVYVGISPKDEHVGVQIGLGTLEDLANKIKVNTDPPQFPTIDVRGPENSAIIEIHIEQNPVKPVWAFGRPIKRVGRTNQFLRREEAQRLLEITTGRTWDAFICDRFSTKDIDKKTVREYLDRIGMNVSTPLDDLARNLRISSERGFCNAAVLLFGKCPQNFFIEAQVKCARFKGIDSVDFIDERTFEGNILRQFDDAMAFVTRNTRQAIRITGKPAHDVIPEYPEEAVREAIVNALCHRNYADVGTIQVRIYDNRLEVWNPGCLPHDLTIKKLYHQHSSRPWNPLIASALFRARYIEHWGTGTLRIIKACKEQHIKAEFKTAMGCFIVTLRQQDKIVATQLGAESRPESQPESRPESQPESLEHRILQIVGDGALGKASISDALGQKEVSGQLNQVIRLLLKKTLLSRTIPAKPNSRLQKYRVTEQGRAWLNKRQNSLLQ